MFSRMLVPALILSIAATLRAQTYTPINASAFFNESRAGLINGSTFPLGNQVFGGVPFTMGTDSHYCDTSNWNHDDLVHVATLNPNLPGVDRVFMLVNSEAGAPGPTSYLSVAFHGSAGAQQTFNLIGNVDLRNYDANGGFTQNINGTTTINVFQNGMGQRIDRIEFDLPAAFLTQTLNSIVWTDSGHSLSSPFQRGILFGVTAEQPVPEPTTIALMVMGGIAVLKRRRAARAA